MEKSVSDEEKICFSLFEFIKLLNRKKKPNPIPNKNVSANRDRR